MSLRDAWSRIKCPNCGDRKAPGARGALGRGNGERSRSASPKGDRTVQTPSAAAHSAVAVLPATRASKRADTIVLPSRTGTLCWGMVGLLALGALGLGWRSYRAANPVHASASAPGTAESAEGVPFKDYRAAPGLVEASTENQKLSFHVSGKIRKLELEEGAPVKAGQIIAELENADLVASKKSAAANLQAAQERLKLMAEEIGFELVGAQREVDRLKAERDLLLAGARKESIDRVSAEVEEAAIELEGRKKDAGKFVNKAVTTDLEHDERNRMVELAAKRLQAAQSKLKELMAPPRKEDLAKAEALLGKAESDVRRIESTREIRLNVARQQAKDAEARVDSVQAELDKTVLRSPISGVVVWKLCHAGESVGMPPPEPVVVVANCSDLRVHAMVDERDFACVHPGQRVAITTEAYPGRYFLGKVERLGNSTGEKPFLTKEAKEQIDIKVVKVIVRFDSPPPFDVLKLRVKAYFEVE